jgi:hypothetical protein
MHLENGKENTSKKCLLGAHCRNSKTSFGPYDTQACGTTPRVKSPEEHQSTVPARSQSEDGTAEFMQAWGRAVRLHRHGLADRSELRLGFFKALGCSSNPHKMPSLLLPGTPKISLKFKFAVLKDRRGSPRGTHPQAGPLGNLQQSIAEFNSIYMVGAKSTLSIR